MATGTGWDGRLWREGGRLMFRYGKDGDPVAVKARWARPLSDRAPDVGGPVSLMLAGRKIEAAWIPDPSALPDGERRLLFEELRHGTVIPRILRIRRVHSRFGNYYWDVETDLGPRRFLLSSPETNSITPAPGVVMLKDVFDNCYELRPESDLDRDSLREMERVL
ncbi:MAG: DUF1854 domain-containing protein [Planctomycetota bacterium]|nr:DUF1854 domain-containing protein [Planctomycetota bacterium]